MNATSRVIPVVEGLADISPDPFLKVKKINYCADEYLFVLLSHSLWCPDSKCVLSCQYSHFTSDMDCVVLQAVIELETARRDNDDRIGVVCHEMVSTFPAV